jgi:esterase/lipase
MIEEKVIFIIPGFKHLPTDKPYKDIASLLRNEGYKPVLVSIPWHKKTISENVEFFLKESQKITAKKKYILGFSFGAMIAFIASTKMDTSGLILCSLSPYFSEDILKIKSIMNMPKKTKRQKDYLRLQSTSLAGKIKSNQVLLLYGANEEKSLINRVTETFHTIASTNKKLVPIRETDHDIGNTHYLQAIHKIARELN